MAIRWTYTVVHNRQPYHSITLIDGTCDWLIDFILMAQQQSPSQQKNYKLTNYEQTFLNVPCNDGH